MNNTTLWPLKTELDEHNQLFSGILKVCTFSYSYGYAKPVTLANDDENENFHYVCS